MLFGRPVIIAEFRPYWGRGRHGVGVVEVSLEGILDLALGSD